MECQQISKDFKIKASAICFCISIILLGISGFLFPFQSSANQQQQQLIVGKPRVVDGDTVVIAGERIRLAGIDAPEKSQKCKTGFGIEYACGLESKDFLQKIIGNDDLFCSTKSRDRYGRYVGQCSIRKGQQFTNVNDYMVREGQAVAYRQYSKEYVAAEEEAINRKKGLWSGSFEVPSEFRKQKRGR